MIDKWGVTASGAGRADTKIRPGACVFAVFGSALREMSSMAALPDRDILFRISDVTGDGVDELFQRVRSLNAKEAAAVTIGVDVERSMLLEFIAVIFRPLRGAEQHGLFAVPCAINDG